MVAYIYKQGGTHSVEMCALLWKIMTWCHHYHLTLKARHIPGCLNVMADLSTFVQTDLPKVVHTICRLICHSSEPQTSTVRISCPRPKCLGHRCSEHKLDGSHCLFLPCDGSPSQGDPKIRQYHCLIIVIAPGWPGMPWFWDLVQLSTEIPLQLPVSTTLLKQSHNHLNLHAWCLGVDSSKKQGFSVEVAERIAAPQRSSTRTIYKSKWTLFQNGPEKIWWISPLHL